MSYRFNHDSQLTRPPTELNFQYQNEKIYSKNSPQNSGFRKLTLILLQPPNPEMLHRIAVVFEKSRNNAFEYVFDQFQATWQIYNVAFQKR